MRYEFMQGAKVYKVINGIVHKFCGHCQTPTPITWGETTGHIGKLVFRRNNNLGKLMANGVIDMRNPLCFPATKKVTLCPDCVGQLNEIARTTPPGHTPFLPVKNL